MMKNSTTTLLLLGVLAYCHLEGTVATVEVHVGVVLDMAKLVGKMGLSCINMALSDFYKAHPSYKTRLVLHTRDAKDDIVTAAAAVDDLIQNVQVKAILGPETSTEAQFVINLGQKAQVPIMSFSATSSLLSSISNPYFVRATQNDSTQVQAISAIIQAFGWRQVVPVYMDNEFGGGLVPYLADMLQQLGTRIPYRSLISPSTTNDQIVAELYKLKTMQTRVFVVHLAAPLGARLFMKAKQLGMMSQDYVWIITNSMANVLSSISAVQSMEGVLGVKTYFPMTTELQNFNVKWKTKFLQDNPTMANAKLNVYGLWAHDAASALAKAVEHIGPASFSLEKANRSSNISTNLFSFKASQIGPRLLQAILSTKFKGLSGDFNLINGQLQSSTFQLINVIGNGEKGIGFWTPSNGLQKELKTKSTGSYSTSRDNLGAIVWPGDSLLVPKGWVFPTNGENKLRVGVPIKDGFNEFVKVTPIAGTNATKVSGYCIDVFDAVMASLPYHVPYKYVPFSKPDGESAGTYDDLIYQVYLQNYDAVVGDITIIANRSLYVDFSLPYTESGVTMVVRTKDDKAKTAWVFLRPLTWDLWFTSFCFFVLMAFIIWVLEHQINPSFRGPPGHQAGTSLYYSFATMVFANSQPVYNNLTRIVLIVWMFVLLILTSSFTASLASLLTVERFQPTITDVKELIKRGDYVGYQEGSFVRGLLPQMNFHESKLRSYDSAEQMHQLLSKGSANGGIAAAFDEVSFAKLLISSYCRKYTMVPLPYKTDGFGFVFPIGSVLVSDVSRAILNVTEGDKMAAFEKQWFGQQHNCSDSSSSVSSSSLTLDNFSGLFMIAGGVAALCLILFMSSFLYKYRRVWLHPDDPNVPILTRIKELLRIFDQKNLESHTFKIGELKDASLVAASPSTHCPPSPSSYSTHTEEPFIGYGKQSSPSPEHAHRGSFRQDNQQVVIEIADLCQERQRTPC